MTDLNYPEKGIRIELIPYRLIRSIRKNKIKTAKYNADNPEYVLNAFSIRNTTIEDFIEMMQSNDQYKYTAQQQWVTELIMDWLEEIKCSELFHEYEFFVLVLWLIRMYEFFREITTPVNEVEEFLFFFNLRNIDLFEEFEIFGWECLVNMTSNSRYQYEGEDVNFDIGSMISGSDTSNRTSLRRKSGESVPSKLSSDKEPSLPDTSSITTFFEKNQYKFERQIEFLMQLTRECLYSHFRFSLIVQVMRNDYYWKYVKLNRPIHPPKVYYMPHWAASGKGRRRSSTSSTSSQKSFRRSTTSSTSRRSSVPIKNKTPQIPNENCILPLELSPDINESYWEKLMMEATLNELYYNIFNSKTDNGDTIDESK